MKKIPRFRREITLAIILLFIGMIFTPLTVSNEIEQYSVSIFNDGSLSGYVNDTSMNPIEGALVRVYFHETYEENYTDSSGYYHVTNIPICYCMKNCTASKRGYRTEWVLLSIDENTTQDFILMSNHPPSAPDIVGETSPTVGLSYGYDFISDDLDGDNVSYYIDWGDGNITDWTPFQTQSFPVYKESHIWDEIGTYTLKAKAKDIYGSESDWTPPYIVIAPKSQNMWYLRWLDRFPILNQIVNLLMEKWI